MQTRARATKVDPGMSAAVLQSQPLSSSVDVAFWHTLSQKKLEDWKLSTEAVRVWAGACPSGTQQSRVLLGEFSYRERKYVPRGYKPMEGALYALNTVEDFKGFDKAGLLKQRGAALWDDIRSGRALEDPSKLNPFVLLAFPNLKTHRYYYWFAFPALVFPANALSVTASGAPEPLTERLPAARALALLAACAKFSASDLNRGSHFVAVLPRSDAKAGEVCVVSLAEFAKKRSTQSYQDKRVIFGFSDPCALPRNPGWPVRNLAVLLAQQFSLQSAEVLCLRDDLELFADDTKADASKVRSMIIDVTLVRGGSGGAESATVPLDAPRTVGWERNQKDRLGARCVDLRSIFDPKTLARTSADLNLKLMRWRSLPDLDLNALKSSRCLLLGAGTLGCNVARTLLGWGIRNITFVDNGRVSYSNPVRQPLFSYQDSVGGKSMKALTAARNLMAVCPSAKAEGHVLTIPMPGHSVPPKQVETVRKETERLEKLIQSHDVVFLLTDSRESRWLPSVVAAAHNKLLLNAALGFDTYVVMQHGRCGADGKRSLGCYFCNDVVAPTDSLTDRTLDQQCTVTRPGAAPVAAALAVELAVALINSGAPDAKAADGKSAGANVGEGSLGSTPHQIRGSLRKFDMLSITGKAYDKCTACSDTIVNLYRKEGWKFILDALNKPKYLEDVTGLTQMKAAAEAIDVDIDWDSSEEF